MDFDETIDTFYEYLKTNLSLPCEVTGIEDFRWEEFYVFGPGNKKEYEQLKKNIGTDNDASKVLQASWVWLKYRTPAQKAKKTVSRPQRFREGLPESFILNDADKP